MVVYLFAIKGRLDKFERHFCTACETDASRGDSARRLSSKHDTPLPATCFGGQVQRYLLGYQFRQLVHWERTRMGRASLYKMEHPARISEGKGRRRGGSCRPSKYIFSATLFGWSETFLSGDRRLVRRAAPMRQLRVDRGQRMDTFRPARRDCQSRRLLS